MKHVKQLLSALLVLAVVLSLLPAGVLKASAAEAPAALDIGYPTFKNTELLDEVYDLSKLGVSYSEKDIMMAIYKQDLANGGDSFYMDRILAREGVCNGNAGSNGNADGNTFLTRGRALYMYTSSPSVIGFGGNTAYHQPLGRGDLVRVLFSNADGSLTTKEDTSKRVNAPSNWSSTYSVGSNLTLDVVKFIHQENVAVTTMTLTNKSAEDQAITVAADSTFATEPGKVTVNGAEQTELTGTCSSPAGLTTIYARMTGDGFEAASSDDYCWLSRDVTVPAGGSVELKVVIAFTTEEIPESTEQYLRFAGLGNLEAVRAQKAEYNLYWAENLPYIDVPKKAVQKAIDYRWWLERFNSLDANIPGYDYQYARQMAETYQKVVEIKAELIDYLAEAQAAAEKAEAERKAAEEARKAAEEAALAASKYAASFELAQLLHESETLTGHAREDYAKVIEDAKAAIEAAKTPEEVDEILAAAREALKTAGCPSTNFTDVEENGWYHTGVDFMVRNGFMNGVADDAFDVDGNLTRAQLVTILYRIAGEPESTATNPFADVADGQWYTNAVIWAAENGIVKGVNTTTFAPNDQITREQIATILFRYAKAEKVEGKLAGFPDAEKVSDYAADAMAWAVEQGLINGISESDGKTYLAPQETATRAQIAVILMRYLTAEN